MYILYRSFVGEPTGERPIGPFTLTNVLIREADFQNWEDAGDNREEKVNERGDWRSVGAPVNNFP